MSGHSVLLNWTAPEFGQIRTYTVWRAVGSFNTIASIYANGALFRVVGTVTGKPPKPTFPDMTVKNNTTYTYFVVETNAKGVQSAASVPVMITVKF
jgi:hypothetical protein